MNKFLSLILLVAVLGARKSTANVPTHEFYPFGTHHGDAVVPTADDNFVEHDLSQGCQIHFFGQGYDKVFINNNGGISFVNGVPQYTPTCGPQGTPMIIPFWADVDTTQGGTVFYRESTDHDVLIRATQDVLTAFPGLSHSLNINRVMIITWHDVAFFGSITCGEEANSLRNSFQTLIALGADGEMSFIIFNYDSINWTTGRASGGECNGRGGTPAKSGFDVGDHVNFVSLPGSCSEEIGQIVETTNVNHPGRWIFRVDQLQIEDPSETMPHPVPEDPEVPGEPGVCNPNDCSLVGYCYQYAQCDTMTRDYRVQHCSHGLYWNPHNHSSSDEVVIEMGHNPVLITGRALRARSLKQTRQFEFEFNSTDGGYTEYPYPEFTEQNNTDYPFHQEQCHGSCDVWENLPPQVQHMYLTDETCFPKCTYQAVAECENRYIFHSHNTDAREVEYVHCPVDTRHGNHIPMVWVQERETCDFCYNAYRTDYNGTFEPCCERYDGLGNDTDFHVEEITSDNHHGYDHHFTGAPVEHNNEYDSHFNGAPAYHNEYDNHFNGAPAPAGHNEYDSHFNGAPAYHNEYDSHFNGAPAYHNEYDSHFNGAPAYHNEYDNHFNGAPAYHNEYDSHFNGAPAYHNEYDSHFNGAPVPHNEYDSHFNGAPSEWNAPGGYDMYAPAAGRSLNKEAKTFDLKKKVISSA